jgi:hypothetical protein
MAVIPVYAGILGLGICFVKVIMLNKVKSGGRAVPQI